MKWIVLLLWGPFALMGQAFEEIHLPYPSGGINCLLERSRGQVLVGSEKGLFLWEGNQFKPVKLRESNANVLLADGQGNVWIGHYMRGLSCMHADGRVAHYPFANGQMQLITALAFDAGGKLLAGTANMGIFELSEGKLHAWPHSNKLPSRHIHSMMRSNDGALFIGTGDGLLFIDTNGKPKVHKMLEGVHALLAAGEGIYACTLTPNGPQIWESQDGKWRPASQRLCQPTPRLHSIAKGGQYCWIGSDGGLIRFNGKACKVFDTRHGLGQLAVTCALEMPDSSVWVGTADGGLYRLANAPMAKPKRQPVFGQDSLASGVPLRLGQANFQQSTAILADSAAAMEELRQLATFMQEHPQFRVEIHGHTDSQGNQAANWELSKCRAQKISAILVGLGLNLERIKTVWHGETLPIETNATPQGRAQNRRVEVLLKLQ